MIANGLTELEARLRQDLRFLNYPPENWIPPSRLPDGQPVCDVLIIGGGMCGLLAFFALKRAGIRNTRIVDRSPNGFEGPWVTYARMDTLRSPKQLLGPAYGVAALTFQAWFCAQYGEEAWNALFRISRPMWMDYLRWYRRVLDVPVENGVDVTRIEPGAQGLLEMEVAGGSAPAIHARRVVLANGREGLGAPTIPDFISGLPRDLWAHSSDDIDFAALKGKRVVVIGVGASAVDNAGTALEGGAAEVRLLARRKQMPTVNKLMGIGSYGLTTGFPKLSPAWRWRIMDYAAKQQTPAPRNSTQRVSRHPNAFFHFGCDIRTIRLHDGDVTIEISDDRLFTADFVILGTGFSVEPLGRPELESFADKIATWGDFHVPPPDEANPALARFPWLADDFSFTEKRPGTAPSLANIHCFNYGATLSLGKVSGDIPAVSEGALWLARGVAAAFYAQDIEAHWKALQAYEKPELLGDEWTDADADATKRY